jgi:hypothetical protein
LPRGRCRHRRCDHSWKLYHRSPPQLRERTECPKPSPATTSRPIASCAACNHTPGRPRVTVLLYAETGTRTALHTICKWGYVIFT